MRLFPKLALWVSLLLMATVVCLTLSFYWMEQRQMRLEAQRERQALLENVVHITRESFLTNDDLLLVAYIRWLTSAYPALDTVSVVDASGEVIAHSKPAEIGKMRDHKVDTSVDPWTLNQVIPMGGEKRGQVSLTFSSVYENQLLQARAQQLQQRLIQVAGLALGVGLLMSLQISKSWTRPVRQLTRLAERIGQGHWMADVPLHVQRQDELGVLSRAFRSMALQLGQLDAMKDDFVSAVTHELRSPLGALESYLNLIGDELRDQVPEEVWPRYLERLQSNTQRLTHFVNDLLDVAALERGKVVLERESFDLRVLVQDVLQLFAIQLGQKQIASSLEAPAVLDAVWADPGKIRQVLVNLISNAMKFTPMGGQVRVALSPLEFEHCIQVNVTDSGVGIAPEYQRLIFNKFEQIRTARQGVQGPKGTGLGLALCKALLELHGQSLQVQSSLGQGSTFFFSLPVASEEVA